MNRLIIFIFIIYELTGIFAFAGDNNAFIPSILENMLTGSNSGGGILDEENLINCPPEGIEEGEPRCFDDYVDAYNGGCDSNPPIFQQIQNGDTICGTSGAFLRHGYSYRDTDWYQIAIASCCELQWSGVATFPLLMFIINSGSTNCSDYEILTYGLAISGDTLRINAEVAAGNYWLWVGPSTFAGPPCSISDYVAWVECTVVPCCDVSMTPDTSPVTVPPGGSFGLTGTISNPTTDPIQTDVWVGVKYNNVFYQLWLFNNIALNPGQSLSTHLNQNVPIYAPLGSYEYVAYCGDYNTNKCDSAKFDFTVVAGGMLSPGELRGDGKAQACIAEQGDKDMPLLSSRLHRESNKGMPQLEGWILEGGWNVGEDLPSEYTLIGNYPNPFNATTTITYALASAGNVNLAVYNIAGQRVATLVDGYSEAGQHSVIWDAANYSSGIYFSKLTAGIKALTKRMTLLE